MSNKHIAREWERGRTPKTSKPWLQVNSQVGTLVNQWAQRSDLVTYMAPDAGRVAAAVFVPSMLQIEVNTDIAFGAATTPEEVGDLNDRANQFLWTKATGAILHEAGHARFTPHDLEDYVGTLTKNESEALMMLEETRMEGQVVNVMPQNRGFLRGCAMEIVLGDLQDKTKKETAAEFEGNMSPTRAAAHTAALSLARVSAGVLDKRDLRKLEPVLTKVLGKDLIEKLRALWTEFQSLRPVNNVAHTKRAREIARLWNRLVQDAAESNGEGKENPNGHGHEGDTLSFDDLPDEVKEAIREIVEAAQQAAADARHSSEQEISDQQGDEARAQAGRDAEQEQRQRNKSNKGAIEVFTGKTTPAKSQTSSKLVEERKPTAEERRAANIVGQALAKAKYADRIKTVVSSDLPPGRIRMRAVVQQAGMRESNPFAKTEPFRKIKSTHAIDPKLSVGIMTDVSGSMSGAMEPMAVTSWVIQEAVHRIQDTVASVYYGQDVFAGLQKGEHQENVRIYDAADAYEQCGLAARALDGVLGLAQGSGARLVVIVSDGQYRQEREDELVEMLDRWERSGVAVLWIGYGHSGRAKAHCDARGNMEYVLPGNKPVDVAYQVGKAAVKVLNKTSQMLNSRR